MGASVSDEGVRFRVWAPAVTSISLVIEDESKEIPMDPEGKGYFTTFLSGAESRMRYSYLLNPESPKTGPCFAIPTRGVQGPSEVVDSEDSMGGSGLDRNPPEEDDHL